MTKQTIYEYDKKEKQLLKRWKTKQQLSTQTIKSYESYLKHYCISTGMKITQLQEQALNEEDNHIPPYRRKINDHILDFYEYLEQQTNLTENSKDKAVIVAINFYKQLNITIPVINSKYNNKADPENTERMINKEILRIMISHATTRDKAIISMIALTGQSPQELSSLNITDLATAWNTELNDKITEIQDIFNNYDAILESEPVPLKMTRRKTGNTYYTFLPAETSKHIIHYLQERKNSDNKKLTLQNLNEPLFQNKKGNRLTADSISHVFKNTGIKSGFDEPENFNKEICNLLKRGKGKHRIWKAYNSRKYFINTCRRYAGTRHNSNSQFVFTGVELADYWVGHVPRGSISSYLQYNTDDLEAMRQQYIQAFPHLSLEFEVELFMDSDREELERLKEDYGRVLDELAELKEFIRVKSLFEKFDE